MKFLPIPNHSLGYNPSLDALRGIAVLLVLLFHIYPNIFSFGYVGVDIFFVLSGYLIGGIIITKVQKGNFSFMEFYRNRIRRIFPAMIVVLLFTLLLGYLFLFPSEFVSLAIHIKASSLFYQNINLINEAGYWDKSSTLKPLLHFWSLSIEEQFYLFWPLVVIVVFKIRLDVKIVFFGIVIVLIILANSFELDRFYHSLSRFWELSFGTLVFLLQKDYKIQGKFANTITILLFVAALFFSFGNEEYSFVKTFFIVATTGLLIISLQNNTNRPFGSKVLLFFGLISYPLYLWHYVLISYMHIFGFDVAKYGIYIIIVSTLLAYLTFRFVESYARGVESYRFAIVLFVLVVGIYFAGIYIIKNNGLSHRKSINIGNNSVYLKELNDSSKAESNDNGKVLLKKLLGYDSHIHFAQSTSNDINKKYIMMIGDSHALKSYDGFAKEIARSGKYQFLSLSNNSTIPFYDAVMTTSIKKAQKRKETIRDIYKTIERLKPKKVIILNREMVYLTKTNFGNIPKIAEVGEYKFYGGENLPYEKKYFKEYEKIFKYFKAKNIELFLVHENPELGFNIQECFERPMGISKTKSICGIEVVKYSERTASYKEKIKSIARKYDNVKILDTKDVFCDSRYCYGIKNGKILYSDDNHLTKEGSMLQAKMLSPIILKEQK